jgi:hypothetical protein
MISKDMIEVYLMPLKVMAFIIDKLGADVIKLFLAFNILNSIFPITAAMTALSGKGFMSMGAGATIAKVKIGGLNLQLRVLHAQLAGLALLAGGLGLGLLAIGHYNKSRGSKDGMGVGTYNKIAGVDDTLFGGGREWRGTIGSGVREGMFEQAAEDYMANYGKGLNNQSLETGMPIGNLMVQNLNIDPYGGDS